MPSTHCSVCHRPITTQRTTRRTCGDRCRQVKHRRASFANACIENGLDVDRAITMARLVHPGKDPRLNLAHN